jgi:phosphoenolpyruvate carboxykinase (ATP)
MLTCDAFGVLPPISRLTTEQAMYHFMSGYTARIAGTEGGPAKTPQAVFSPCFGAPFLPLQPSRYAAMLRERIDRHGSSCWLVNTGWSGGGAGTGGRISIDVTRNIINAALDDVFDSVPFAVEPFFNLSIPTRCPGVSPDLLNPRNMWDDKNRYDEMAGDLAARFMENFSKFE